MQTHDTKGAEVYTNGSAGHMNGGEYTRMREVAFEKNPSEPMVRHQAWLHTHMQRVIFRVAILISLSLVGCRESL